jgi:hypothetical protein
LLTWSPRYLTAACRLRRGGSPASSAAASAVTAASALARIVSCHASVLAVAMLDGKQVKIAARRRPDEVETWGR